MKKKWIKRIAVGCTMAFGLSCAAGLAAIQPQTANAAETDYRGWRVSDPQQITAYDKTGVNVSKPTRVEDSYGVKQDFLNVDYIYSLNMEAGQEFAYMLPDDTSLSIGEEVYQFQYPNKEAIIDRGEVINDARYFNHSYVKFTVLNSEDEGFEVIFYHQYADDNAAYPNRIFANLYYLSPSIKADGADKTNGRHYVETVFSYEANFRTWHTMSCFKENDWFFINIDGTSFVPVVEYSDIDLSAARVSIESKSIELPYMQLNLKAPNTKFDRNTYDGTWMTLGESDVTREQDGTLRFDLNEKNDQLSWVYDATTTNMLLRERVISMKGYSVDEPIVIQCSMDIGPQNYYAVKLTSNPFETAMPIKYNLGGVGTTVNTDNAFMQEARLAFSEIGSCMFVGKTAISARIIPEDNPNTTDYYVAWSCIPNNQSTYAGYSSLDEIKFIVGEAGTEVYFNGIFAFTLRNVTRESFADSNYMAYPYFAFSELPPQPEKSNIFHLKGVNAPYVKHDSVTRYKAADGDLTFDANFYGVEAKLYYDKECRQVVDTANYVYEAGEDGAVGTLTLKPGVFRGRPFGLNSVYVVTENGMDEISVRYLPDSYVELTPEIVTEERDELGNYKVFYERKIVTGYDFIYDEEGNIINVGTIYTEDSTLDLRMSVKFYEHEFVRVYGYGITSAQYMYNERQGTLLIRNAFLMSMDNGTYTFTLVTQDSDGVERQTKFTIEIVNYLPFEIVLPGEEEEQPTDTPANNGAMISCSANMANSYVLATSLLLGAAYIVTLKKRQNENQEGK